MCASINLKRCNGFISKINILILIIYEQIETKESIEEFLKTLRNFELKRQSEKYKYYSRK